jgi:hypothetical protein
MENDVERDGDLLRLAIFLGRLRKTSIHFTVTMVRKGAIMVEISVPGERWEVEFLEDGAVDVERFVSTGKLQDDSVLDELFARFSD